MNPSINLRLAAARTPSDANLVWRDFFNELEDFTFVLSLPGPGVSRFSARLDLPGGAFLRSVFAHEHLYFLNHAIIKSSLAGDAVNLTVDYTISFDSNTASYFRNSPSGSPSKMAPTLHACLKALGSSKLNWDYIPFLMERAESILANRDLDFIYETVLAAERFAACDKARFEATGEVHVAATNEEMARRAQHELATWHATLRRGVERLIPYRLNFFYAAVLKLAVVHRRDPKTRSALSNMAKFLEFLDSEVRCISLLVVGAALEFFLKGGAFGPLSKIADGTDLKAKAKNIAWDFYHVAQRQESTNYSGRNGAFHLPFFLTFDRGLACLFDTVPQRSCLIGKDGGMPQFYADFDFVDRLNQLLPELLPVMKKHFNIQAHTERMLVTRNSPPDLAPVIKTLEAELDKSGT